MTINHLKITNFQRSAKSIRIVHMIRHVTTRNASIHVRTVELNADEELNAWHKIIKPTVFVRPEHKATR